MAESHNETRNSPLIGLPPSSVGGFHFKVTEPLSYLAISTSFGSVGGSEFRRITIL